MTLPAQKMSDLTCISRQVLEKFCVNVRSSSYAPVEFGGLSFGFNNALIHGKTKIIPRAGLLKERNFVVDAQGGNERYDNTLFS